MRLAEEWGALVRAPKIALAKGERQRERIVTEEEFNLYITGEDEDFVEPEPDEMTDEAFTAEAAAAADTKEES